MVTAVGKCRGEKVQWLSLKPLQWSRIRLEKTQQHPLFKCAVLMCSDTFQYYRGSVIHNMSFWVLVPKKTPSALAWSFNSLALFVLSDRQELYHSKPQWHSKASIFTTCKHQWPNLKDWLIPLLTWLAASGCVYERQPSLFNSARCQGEKVMSFKLHCYASPCFSFTSFQVQAYFEEEAQKL